VLPIRKLDEAFRLPLVVSFVVLAILKLWLVADQEIVATLHGHDDLWYIKQAAAWIWGRPYDSMAIAQLPGYSAFIALNRLTGLPLRLTTELLYIASAWSMASATQRIGVLTINRIFIFALIVFHPHSIGLFNYTRPDPFTACLYLLLVGQLIRVLDRPTSKLDMFGLAAVAASLVLSRKESVGLLIILAAAVVAFLVIWRKRIEVRQYARALIAVPLMGAVAAWAFFAIGNGVVYGVWSPSDIDMGKQAYAALQSVHVDNPQRYVPISRETRLKAYAVSPSFAELQPLLDGPTPSWGERAGKVIGIQDDIGAGWLHWVLRWGAEQAGHFRTAAAAQAYFDRITLDIRAAEADGRLSKRFTLGGFLDPAFMVWAPLLPQSLRVVSAAAWATAPGEAFKEAAQTADLYTRVTNRKVRAIDPARERLRHILTSWYVPAWLTLLLAALAASMLRSDGWSDLHKVTIAIVALLILSRIGLFAVIDASAWQGNQTRYLFPVGTLVMIFPFLALPGRSSRLSSIVQERRQQVAAGHRGIAS